MTNYNLIVLTDDHPDVLEAQYIWNAARNAGLSDLNGYSLVDLLADNMNRPLAYVRRIADFITNLRRTRAARQRVVRSYLRALRADRAWFRDCAEFGVADAKFDAGEFGGGSAADDQAMKRLDAIAAAVGARYGMTADELETAVYQANDEEMFRFQYATRRDR